MKVFGAQLAEGSAFSNLTVASGLAFPGLPNEGELFYLDANDTTEGLYLYVNTAWKRFGFADETGALTGDLLSIEGISTTGVVRRIATDAWTAGGGINLTSEVVGVLPLINGGTGAATALDAFNVLLPTQVTPGQVLTTNGANPYWSTISPTSIDAEYTGVAAGLMSTHTGATDPHAQYLLEAEAAAMYAMIEHAHDIHNVVKVCHDVTLGSYTSIEAAIAAAIAKTPSATNRIIVQVQPGVYNENPFTVPAYVYVIGPDPWNSVQINAINNDADFITISPNSGMFQVAVGGPTTSGFAAIKQVASGTTKLYWINLRSFKIGVKLAPVSGAARCHCIAVVSDSASGGLSERMFSVDNSVGAGIFIMMMSGPMSTSLSGGYGVYLNGPTANATIDLCQFRGTGATQLYVNGGASVRGISCSFAQGSTAIDIGPDGASRVDMHGTQIKPGMFTTDINIQSASAIVTYSGVATLDKILNPLEASLTASISDNVRGQVILGEMWIGSKAVQTPLTSYIQADKNSGVIEGGTIARGPGILQVTVAAGSGFVDISSGLKKVTWIQTVLDVPVSTSTKAYVDSDGLVLMSASPTPYITIELGDIVTGLTEVEVLTDDSIILPQFRKKLFDYLTHVVGPINATGGTVVANALSLDVSPSTYYVTEDLNVTAGGTAITFRYWYRDGAGGWKTSNTNVVSPNFYDNGSGTLVAVPAGKFKRDALYVGSNAGGTDYHVFYGQEVFDTAQAALVNPLVQAEIQEHACRLAGIVLQQGTTTITSVIDDRPKLGQMASGSSSVTAHNDLTGRDSLTAHTQYQLISEKGQANGYLGLNGSAQIAASYFPLTNTTPANVTKAAAVVGVSTEMARSDHKHDVSTAAPSSLGTGNSEGTSTSLARADHVHAHGNQTSATLHAVATTGVNGFMSSADKTKLDAVRAIAEGGTGQTTANNALNALLPTQTGNADKVLSTNGTTTAWVTAGGAPVANSMLQRVEYGITGTTGTSTLPTSTPTVSNGTAVLVATITPTSATSNVLATGSILLGTNGTGGAAIAIWRKIGTGAEVLVGGLLTESHNHNSNQRTQTSLSVTIDDNPGTTQVVTYTFRAGTYNGSGSWYVAQPGLGNWGGAFSAASRIALEEHLAA